MNNKLSLVILLALLWLTACDKETQKVEVNNDDEIIYEKYERVLEPSFFSNEGTLILKIKREELIEISLFDKFYIHEYYALQLYDLEDLDPEILSKSKDPRLGSIFLNDYSFEGIEYSDVVNYIQSNNTNDELYVVTDSEVIQSVKPDSKIIIRNRVSEIEQDSNENIYHNSSDSLEDIRKSIQELNYVKKE